MSNPISFAPSPRYQVSVEEVEEAEPEAVEPTEVSCTAPAIAVATAGLGLARSALSLAAGAPTVIGALPGVLGFIGSSVSLGVALASYADCRDEQPGEAPGR